MKLDVWHNIMWSRYKAKVLSELHQLATERGISLRVFQIAETDRDRKSLSGVELSAHAYPVNLLFSGAYSDIPTWKLVYRTAVETFRSPADVILVAGYHRPEFILQIMLARLMRRRVAVFCDSTINDNPQTRFKGLIKRLVFSQLYGAFCYGERSAEYLRHYGVPDSKIFRRCQAAAVDDGRTPAQRLARRAALGSDVRGTRFLFVGRLAAEKGLDTLLQAFAQVRAQSPHSTLRIVGNGPLAAVLARQVDELALSPSVSLVGPRSGGDLWDEYAAADWLVLPSRSEPWGLVVNEALSFGCQIIATDICGCVPELLGSGKCGFVVPVNDIAALAAAMTRATAVDPETAARRAIDAQEVVAPYTARAAAASILNGSMTLWRGT